MKKMENNHIRYCCWSQTLWDKLKELGFKENGSDPSSKGTQQVKRFVKGDLLIEDSYNAIYLYKKITQTELKGQFGDFITKYHGQSVNKELLENFAAKGIYNN